MGSDVIDLRDFYASTLGQVAAQRIAKSVLSLWPHVKGASTVGIGYPVPYFAAYKNRSSSPLAFMPAEQGVLHWPSAGPNASTLVHPLELPLPDESVDRILVIHQLEHCQTVQPFLREIWRVLASTGRLLIVVPNRRGLWAQAHTTPFGRGLPYSKFQLMNVLRDNMFTPTRSERGLYSLPSASALVRLFNPFLEFVGPRILRRFSGVVCVEAIKKVYASALVPSKQQTVGATFVARS